MVQPAPIIVAHAPIGSGHRIAAEAIAAEIGSLAADAVSVKVMDALALGTIRPSTEGLTSAFTGPTAGMYDAIWFSPALGRACRAVSLPVLARTFRRFTQSLLDARPAAVVCTHALPALLAARVVQRRRLSTKVICIATDFGVHSFWPREEVSLFCVPDASTAENLVSRGYRPSQVAVTGIPIRSQFTLDYDRSAAREHFGLPSDARVLLAMAGSTVAGPYVHFKAALATSLPALASMADTAVVIVTGQDAHYADELRSRASGFGVSNVHILGFVERMAPLMAASDLGMAKPGGLVCAESMSMNLPLVVIGPAAGQERANADALSSAGAALFAKDPRTLAEHARAALTETGRLERMRDASALLAKPFAAAAAAERILELVGVTDLRRDIV